ncbi:MAG: bifunctional 4-hydroxy-3-methylbut-2-enyl diphosphate reductase/30S ribosomal protein S1 [Ruminococcaceae bacterium]|nr:bifunctional 4-hydroxy-3-methylbut-2-enyl diphosphate reductase/30S ribosomal protein S1 [Oscillospiraceae bacterium]
MKNSEIKIAKTAGFCYGVKRAVDEVYERAQKGEKIATLGSLIHNRQVVEELEQKGVIVCHCVDEVPKDTKLIVRTHGVSEAIIRELEQKQIPFVDMTCPFVAKIHRIVSEHYHKGYEIVIVGDENHPEVQGINGWCENQATILYDSVTEIPEKLQTKPVCIVAQTTINRKIFVQIVQILKNTCQSTIVFDTICSATKDRQAETDALASESDVMFVIGGRESSNTKKLYEISKAHCPETYFIETYEDIPHYVYLKNKKIGITAGASTPGRIIEEVFTTMDEKMRNEETFAELFEQYESKTLNNGDIVDGTVIEVRNTEVIVDLGGFKYNGQLAADQLTDDPYAKVTDLVKPGDTIRVYVVGVNDAEGKVVLSRKKLMMMESWNKIKEAYENGEVLEGKIIKAVRGGVIALTDACQVFIPAKQVSLRYVQDLESLLNTEVEFKIIEIDERRKRVVGSARVILEAQKKEVEEKFWADAAVDKEYTGAVKSLTSFGAFVDLGGVDGLVHISELSWNKIKHPSEVVKEGDVLTVYIKELNAETKKISLGYKKAEDNPWVIAKAKYNVGDVVDCKVVRIMPYGAFAEIIPNVDGLIHISQIADKRIEKTEDVLSVGDVVQAKITEADWDAKKISLSIRALIAPPVEEAAEEVAPVEEEPAADAEDTLVDIEQFIADEAAAEAEETEE